VDEYTSDSFKVLLVEYACMSDQSTRFFIGNLEDIFEIYSIYY